MVKTTTLAAKNNVWRRVTNPARGSGDSNDFIAIMMEQDTVASEKELLLDKKSA